MDQLSIKGLVVALTVLLRCFDMLFLKSVIVSSNNIKVWSCNSFFQFWLVMHYLSEMTEEQTLVMCSGHPQGLFPSSPSAPRAIISNGMVIHLVLQVFLIHWKRTSLFDLLSVLFGFIEQFQKKIPTPPTEGVGNLQGVRGSQRPQI